ncbi:MAG: (d)CMP kinase [Pseudomonadota bacterium]
MSDSNEWPVITVDGPGGAGKGTLSALLAEHFGWHLLDSGALYRVVGYAVERKGLWDADTQTWAELAQQLPVTFPVVNGAVRTHYDGGDIEDSIRTEAAAKYASIVAADTGVRAALMMRQKSFVRAPGLIADGRDMGSVVFPGAPLKVFLTASAEERANRRYFQLKEKGESVTVATLLADIEARDERDRTRAISPLIAAPDAIELDSTNMSIDEVLTYILELAKQRQLG